MDAISNFFTSIFGASWKTSLMGLIGGVLIYFTQVGVAFPATAAEWKSALIAAFVFAWGRTQKDSNVSNSPQPVAPQAVAPSSAAVENPAPKV